MITKKIAYNMKVLKNASIKDFFKCINEAHRLSGNSKLSCVKDMIKSKRKFNAGYYDYVIFQFWDLTDDQRDTYLTRFRSKQLIMHVNDESYAHYFDNKDEFNTVFRDYIGRDYINLETASKEQVENFYNSRKKIFCKMKDLECGIGCERIETANFNSFKDFYKYVTDKGFCTLEDVIENHPDLDSVYSNSVNTMRMITLIGDDGNPNLIYAVQKFGVNGRVVDNYGVHGPVDVDTGEFLYPAHSGDTKAEGLYTEHPNSHEKLVGFVTPMFREAKKMVLQASLVIPQIRYVGWDVAITPNGPAIIEGNTYCAHDFWQLPGQTPDGIGIIPTIKKLVPSFKYK